MRESNPLELLLRHPQLETLEERQLMTVAPTPDFQFDYHLEQELNNSNVAATPLGINDITGLNGARANYGLNGAGQTVVVIDSGIAYDHPALGGGFGSNYRVVGGWDFTEENDANPYDDGPGGSHGTHVAGIIGSSDAAHPGLASGVDLVALRVFNDQGAGYFNWMESALQWVHDHRNSFENPITTVNMSIGTTWNATTVPNWTTLEDEFAQLKADGIFISVAAGNSFTTYNTPGLSYPASSPSVVPVASVDDDGSLSYFSQRENRAIAAPGRSITSTVPDYVGNLNRRTDDFATFSGTSMAAPYIAGASVLIRQAMQFVGTTNINQDSIYNLMRDTADSVFDTVTNQSYLRINVGRALDTVMADDFGSTASTAHSLGNTSHATVSGEISRLNDQDYFSFTASASGQAKFTLTSNDGMNSAWQLVGGTGAAAGNQFSFDVVAGRTYTIGLSSTNGLKHYNLTLDVASQSVDLGAIGFLQTGNQSVAGEAWFSISASRNGVLTVEALMAQAGGNVDLQVYNSSMQLVSSSATTGGNERVDVTANASDRFFVRLVGTNANVALRLTNLVTVSGDTVSIAGTTSNDSVRLQSGATQQLTVNGVIYQYAATTRTFDFAASSGTDSVVVVGAAGASVTFSGSALNVSGAAFTFTASCVENTVIDGRLVVDGQGMTGWQNILVGDIDGDGREDIVGRDAATGNWWAVRYNGVDVATQIIGNWSTECTYTNVMIADVNGDGRADLVGRDNFGSWWATSSNGSRFLNVYLGGWTTNANWQNVMVGDVNGDGRVDIVARNASTGDWWSLGSNGGQFDSARIGNWSRSSSYLNVALVDINGDGRIDLVGRDQFGSWWATASNGNRFLNYRLGGWSTTVNWQNFMTGDIDGDGRGDILAQNAATGNWWMIRFDGAQFVSQGIGRWSNPAGFTNISLADLDGDGRAEIVGRDSAGAWHSLRYTSSGYQDRIVGSWSTQVAWQNIGIGDIDGDGAADIVGQNSATGAWSIIHKTAQGFTQNSVSGSTTPLATLRLVDLDGDGRRDLVGQQLNGAWTPVYGAMATAAQLNRVAGSLSIASLSEPAAPTPALDTTPNALAMAIALDRVNNSIVGGAWRELEATSAPRVDNASENLSTAAIERAIISASELDPLSQDELARLAASIERRGTQETASTDPLADAADALFNALAVATADAN